MTPRAMQSLAEIVPTFFVRSTQMRLVVRSSSYSSILGATKAKELLDVFFESFVGFVLASADPEGVRGQARAAILFENLEDLFPVAEGVEQRRHGADIEGVGAKPELMAGDAVEFGQDDADVVGAGRRFDVQQLFNRFAIAEPVRDRSDVIHTVDIRVEHRVGAMFSDLLDSAMEVADDTLEAHDLFAVEPQDDSQNPVGGGVLRTHIEDEFVGIKESVLAFLEIQVRDGAGRVGHASVVGRQSSARKPLLPTIDSQVDLYPFLVLLDDAVVLAQRMTFPTVGQQNALEVGMTVELMPNMSKASRSSQFAVAHRDDTDGMCSPSAICVRTRRRSLRSKE